MVDKRCKAGINLDGLQSGDLLGRPMERPFMFMQSQDAGNINRLFFDRAKGDAYYVVVKGTKHFNYSDFSLLSPDYKKAGLLGTIDGVRMEKIMNTYVLAFFDKYLKGKESALLSKSSADYPEIEFHSRAGQKVLARRDSLASRKQYWAECNYENKIRFDLFDGFAARCCRNG